MAEEHQPAVDQGARAPEPPGSPIVSIGADVDVRALVEQIQLEVARKAEAGLYPPELLMDIEASNWNEDDASNAAAAPDGAPEGMAPSGVNNVILDGEETRSFAAL